MAILGLAFAQDGVTIGFLLCLAGAASASLSLNLYAVAQMFSGPARRGNLGRVPECARQSVGIIGPIVTGIVVQRAGYDSAFILTAAIAASGPPGGRLVSRKSNRSTLARNNCGINRVFGARNPHFFLVALTFSLGRQTRDDSKIRGGGSTR